MRLMIRRVLCVLLLTLFASCVTTPRRRATDLVERWQDRDGAAFLEAGSELTDLAITHPEAFFSAFSANPAAYATWLASIGTHSFRNFGGESAARLNIRLQSLRETAEKYSSHEKCRSMAKSLEQRLRNVSVTAVE
jgi:hypothetical protein